MEKKIKKCANCGLEKDLTEFSKDKQQKDGYTYSCKDCRNKKYNQWAKNNKDKVREKNSKNHEKRKSYYQSEEGVKSSRKAHLKRMFGITLEEYDKKLNEQNGVCEICSEPEKSIRNNFLAVDHSHETGKIRGLLCTNCNRALGLFKDNIELLEKAIKYLKKHKIN